jgi:protein MAK11
MAEVTRPCVISVCTYLGGLLGVSLTKDADGNYDYKDVVTEYNFTACDGSIQCATASQNLLTLGGFNEVVRLFDVRRKRDLGDLMGDHNGTITCLQMYKNSMLISGAEDSEVILWRCKDWTALHKLSIMNKSKVVAMSLHSSGKMLLVLYFNGVLRLWNMMEARCKYKRKINVRDEKPEESENEDADLEISLLKKNDLTDYQLQVVDVKWEPSKGELFCVLFNNMIEVYNVNDASGAELPCSRAVFDVQLTSIDFIGESSIVASDISGNLQILSRVDDQAKLALKQVTTKFERIRQVKVHYESATSKFQFLVALSTDGRFGIWDAARLLSSEEDLLVSLKADKIIKVKDKLTCVAISDFSVKTKGKGEKVTLGKREREQSESDHDSEGDEDNSEAEEIVEEEDDVDSGDSEMGEDEEDEIGVGSLSEEGEGELNDYLKK